MEILEEEVNRVLRLLKDPELKYSETGLDGSAGGKVLQVVGQSRGAKYLHINFKILVQNSNKLTDQVSIQFTKYLYRIKADLRLMRANMITEANEMILNSDNNFELSFKSRVPHGGR